MALGQLVTPMAAVYAAKAAAKPLLDVIRRVPLIDGLSGEGLKPEGKVQGRIEFKNVSFAYPSRPEVKVCNRCELVIEAGETVAIVGCSGGGKVSVYTY